MCTFREFFFFPWQNLNTVLLKTQAHIHNPDSDTGNAFFSYMCWNHRIHRKKTNMLEIIIWENRQDWRDKKTKKADVWISVTRMNTLMQTQTPRCCITPSDRLPLLHTKGRKEGRKERVAGILINCVYLCWERHAGFFGSSPYNNHVRNLTIQAETKLCGRREMANGSRAQTLDLLYMNSK